MNLKKTGKFLAELRKSKELTQKDVAEKIGVLPKTVSKWETGE
ncbi:MAG: helix-turn-helix transcriptional regulator [Ruminococcus sp.]|nr:helix-turn-helix transcriptional regulator [Ruminococcus sp.]